MHAVSSNAKKNLKPDRPARPRQTLQGGARNRTTPHAPRAIWANSWVSDRSITITDGSIRRDWLAWPVLLCIGVPHVVFAVPVEPNVRRTYCQSDIEWETLPFYHRKLRETTTFLDQASVDMVVAYWCLFR
jgi:hypothetical protein